MSPNYQNCIAGLPLMNDINVHFIKDTAKRIFFTYLNCFPKKYIDLQIDTSTKDIYFNFHEWSTC